MELQELIQLCCEKKHIVSLVGAGGKSTLMYELADRCSRWGRNVLVSTTTHIWQPEHNYASTPQEVRTLWNQGTYAVIGAPCSNGKLSVPAFLNSDTEGNFNASPAQGGILFSTLVDSDGSEYSDLRKKKGVKDVLDTRMNADVMDSRDSGINEEISVLSQIWSDADLILLEADGSKCHPCKVPAAHEPVILPESDIVIGVMGMSSLGEPLEEACFRYRTDGQWLDQRSTGHEPEEKQPTGLGMCSETDGISDKCIDEQLIVRILSDLRGTRKNVDSRTYIAVLNQCDEEETRRRAEVIATHLEEEYRIPAIITSFYKNDKQY